MYGVELAVEIARKADWTLTPDSKLKMPGTGLHPDMETMNHLFFSR